jgi:hypothetical protein
MNFFQIHDSNVFLAVVATPGAMGDKGTLKLFSVMDSELIKNKVDVRNDEDRYFEVCDWFFDHSDNYPDYLKSCKKNNSEPKLKRNSSVPMDKLHFNIFYLGFGNHLFLKKNVNFQLSASNIEFLEDNASYKINLDELPPSDEFGFIFQSN